MKRVCIPEEGLNESGITEREEETFTEANGCGSAC